MDGTPSFPLRKTDLRLFRELEQAFRNLLKISTLSPEDIVGLARAIRCVQRLPRCTPDTEVSVIMDFRTENYVACSTIRMSGDALSADYGASSRLTPEYEFESFPSFTMTIDMEGEYDIEGDKQDFFTNFISSAETITESDKYEITVIGDSVAEAWPPSEDDQD
jgi:hypothetical protein